MSEKLENHSITDKKPGTPDRVESRLYKSFGSPLISQNKSEIERSASDSFSVKNLTRFDFLNREETIPPLKSLSNTQSNSPGGSSIEQTPPSALSDFLDAWPEDTSVNSCNGKLGTPPLRDVAPQNDRYGEANKPSRVRDNSRSPRPVSLPLMRSAPYTDMRPPALEPRDEGGPAGYYSVHESSLPSESDDQSPVGARLGSSSSYRVAPSLYSLISRTLYGERAIAVPTASVSAQQQQQQQQQLVRRRVLLRFQVQQVGERWRAVTALKQPKLPLDSRHSPQGSRNAVISLALCNSKEAAIRICQANAPPLWSGVGDLCVCCICRHAAALMRKIHHCRNCGAFVCNYCSSNAWPAAMYAMPCLCTVPLHYITLYYTTLYFTNSIAIVQCNTLHHTTLYYMPFI